MVKRYNKPRNAYFIKLLAGEPWVYKRDEPTPGRGSVVSILAAAMAMSESTMYYRI